MNTEELTLKLLETFPDITVHVTCKNNNLRAHFKAEEHNYVPSKKVFCNALNIPIDQVKIQFKHFDDGITRVSQGKLFIILDGVSL